MECCGVVQQLQNAVKSGKAAKAVKAVKAVKSAKDRFGDYNIKERSYMRYLWELIKHVNKN